MGAGVKTLSVLAGGTLSFIFLVYIIDWGFLKGEITEYPITCPSDSRVRVKQLATGKTGTLSWEDFNPQKYTIIGTIKPPQRISGNGCYPENTTTYKPLVNNQQVIYWSDVLNVRSLEKCSVLNRENWTCKYDDESAEFGFRNGKFFHVSLDQSPLSVRHDWETHYSSRLGYLKQWWLVK